MVVKAPVLEAETGTEGAVAYLSSRSYQRLIVAEKMDPLPPPNTRSTQYPWYCIRTRSNCEKVVSSVLENKGYAQYLPLYDQVRRWSDRTVKTELPLFPGYVFCRFNLEERLNILTTPGVVSVLGFGKEAVPIDDEEVEAIQTAIRSGRKPNPCPFIREGQRIRITVGSLTGLEGILLKDKNEWRIVISITLLQRSVSIEVDRDWVSGV